MNLLRSAELLLHEVVSWLVFFPLTLWRCITRPLDMMRYAEDELTQTPDEQFGLLLSPIIAGAAMSLSSVSVITNALRLRKVRL